MTTPTRLSGELRVAVANLEYGGLSGKGDDSAWRVDGLPARLGT